MLPWSLFLVPGLWLSGRGARSGRRSDRFLLLWFVVLFVFFSAAGAKRSVYLLPAYPAAALLVSGALTRVWRGEGGVSDRWVTVPLYLTCGLLVAAAVVGGVYVWPTWQELGGPPGFLAAGIAGCVVLVAGGVGGVVLARRRSMRRGMMALVLAATAAHLVLWAGIRPALDPVYSGKPVARWLSSRIGEERVVGFYRRDSGWPKEGPTLEFYGDLEVRVVRGLEDVRAFADRSGGRYVIVEKDEVERARKALPEQARAVRDVNIGGDRFIIFDIRAAASRERQKVKGS
jgi:4-amino-4-deoxy-L-arabinose transferase-like glycosyltransferase